MRHLLFACCLACGITTLHGQGQPATQESRWVDSVINSLSDDQKIAQLVIIRAHSNLGADHVAKVEDLIRNYNVGGLCFFQGGPVRQALLTNAYQRLAKTPLLISIDAEWGLGMRLDSVTRFPYQLTLGAMDDPRLVYAMGRAIARQCRRMGIQVNFAPDADINNNPDNPVIGFRSFGEDREKVTRFALAYMRGLQDEGIMACAKHFPGHGDVSVDSHLDLPVIRKSMGQLDSLELYPFRALVQAGIRGVMVAHLSVPAIDTTAHLPTSLSYNNITGLLRNQLGFSGLTFTDALEMKGVTRYYPGAEASVQALIAGNDMLCLPEDVGATIDGVKKAIAGHRIGWGAIYEKLRRVLRAKYELGLAGWQPVDTAHLLADLNEATDNIRAEVARQSITLVKSQSGTLPDLSGKRIAYVGIGLEGPSPLGNRLRRDLGADLYSFSYGDSTGRADTLLQQLRSGGYDQVITGIHGIGLRPSNHYGISQAALACWSRLDSLNNITVVFGNALSLRNFCQAGTLLAGYQDDSITQQEAAGILEGDILPRGTLPVSLCSLPYGSGIVLGRTLPGQTADAYPALRSIDSIASEAVARKVFPGCVVFAARDGKVIYYKAFGQLEYGPSPRVSLESVYDLASVTKVSATTLSVMKLYQEGRLDLDRTLGDYLPWTRGTDKARLKIRDILLHQAGLVPFIPFYRETIDTLTGIPNPALYADRPREGFTTRVAEHLYLRNDWNDTIMARILKSPLGPAPKYVYSDLDFIFMGKIVEAITGMSLDQYVQKTFYDRLGMATTGFLPRRRFPLTRIAPTEDEEDHFRRQLIWGDVHDEGASLLGGVAGHAGLFSDAYDLALLYQMLLNGGELNGVRLLRPETIRYFTAYHSAISRRGLGFDKPEKDNAKRSDPYPCRSASPETFGHTGFTGTCVWADPQHKLVFILLSNRVYPTRNNNTLSELNIRPRIQEAIYEAIRRGELP
ncbi:MAG TPA: glycoside hydrolase family 3 N-terminal domain-containing protein [Chitinophagaceae bacterium]|nr:glycoside hydrolase family 3 N-terminal domain-containing protein [Chitinophagaceae bacterium]